MRMLFPEGRRKALTLSYDDGVEQDIRLLEILNAHGLKCTFNLNSGCFAPEGQTWPAGQIHRRLSASRVQALYGQDGHEVAVHCLTHADLVQQTPAGMVREIYEDRRNLEAMFGPIIRGAAYPYGTYNDQAVEALRNCGITFCRTVESSHSFEVPTDWLRLRPTCHHDDPALDQLCDRFLADSFSFRCGLFYLWGHAYEFEANDNWQRIETFAARMGGRDDIWYAGNSAICDYVRAWCARIPSADGRWLRNPTATPLWLETDAGEVRCAAPGETVRLA